MLIKYITNIIPNTYIINIFIENVSNFLIYEKTICISTSFHIFKITNLKIPKKIFFYNNLFLLKKNAKATLINMEPRNM